MFFCCIYDDQCRKIYQIQAEKEKRKKGKEQRLQQSNKDEKNKKMALKEKASVDGKEPEQLEKKGKLAGKKVEHGKEKIKGEVEGKSAFTKSRKKIETRMEHEKGKGKKVYLKKGITRDGVNQKNVTESVQKKEKGITGKGLVFKKLTVTKKLTGTGTKKKERLINKINELEKKIEEMESHNQEPNDNKKNKSCENEKNKRGGNGVDKNFHNIKKKLK